MLQVVLVRHRVKDELLLGKLLWSFIEGFSFMFLYTIFQSVYELIMINGN